MNKSIALVVSTCMLFISVGSMHAQGSTVPANINVQGVLRKANGVAVDDGPKDIIFKLYENLTGGSAIWTEPQTVEITSGIYSTVLGSIEPFGDANVTWDTQYFLEVEVDGKQLDPRIPLTPAPYALSLLGDPNTFPSSGAIRADGAVFGEDLDQPLLDLSPAHSVVVKGGLLARGVNGVAGAPGVEGVNNNGYAFENDKETGMFSTGTDQVALYTDNTERLLVKEDTVYVNTDLNAMGTVNALSDVHMRSDSRIRYNGLDDWRLVETDYLESGAEGWKIYSQNGSLEPWESTSSANASTQDFGDFAGIALLPDINDKVFKKQFDLSGAGSYTFVKVVFRYYMIDTWDGGNPSERGWAAFADTENGTNVRSGWAINHSLLSSCHFLTPSDGPFNTHSNFAGTASTSDSWQTGTMIGRYPSSTSTSFWIFFGYANDEGESNENFAVGSIEIWVK